VENILISKLRNIGDVLLITPLIKTIKIAFPHTKIYLLVNKGTEEVIAGNKSISEVFVLSKKESKILDVVHSILLAFRIRTRNIDLLINTTESDKGIIIGRLAGAKEIWSATNKIKEKKWRKRIVTRWFSTLGEKKHTVLRNLDFATPITCSLVKDVTFYLTKQELFETEKIMLSSGWSPEKRSMHIHPVSRWMFKAWPPEKVSAIIDWLDINNIQTVLTSSSDPVEMDLIKKIQEQCSSSPINLSGKLSIKMTGAVTYICKNFFGIDSAPMHIAASTNAKILAIFGPTNPIQWAPWPHNQYQEIPNQHISIINKNWPCVPCGGSGCENLKKSACIDCISVDEVIEQIKKTFEIGQ
jgi:heptosyltransferase-3